MATEEPVVATEPEVQPIAAESKKKEPKPRKPRAKKPSTHPPYFEMISDAITSLKERNGSSQQAIQKFIEQKHKQLPANFRKLLLTNLKKSVADAKLVKVKASYKLPPARNSGESPAKKKTTKPPKMKVNAGKSSAPAKKTANKASPAKAKAGVAKPKEKAPAKPKTKAPAPAKKKAPVKEKAGAKRKAAEKAKEKKPAKVAKTAARSTPASKAAVPAKKKVAEPARKAPARDANSPATRASTRKGKK